ncbi:MAG: hypothetical protein JWP97_1685 [Labilithrix sp.]|nr:hypothetical protein [Labilithrix sp.]
MKTNESDDKGVNAAGEKGEKVRKTIGAMLSSEERGKEPDAGDAPGTLSAREPVPTSGKSPAEIAAQERLAEIERHVGELVKDPELEREGAAREAKR